jgi:peptidoglycan-N-acetylglucosamine deacetylase
MVVGPVLYRAPRPGRHRRRRTATLVLLLALLAAAAMVAVRPWTTLHHPAAIRTAASTRPARSRPTARGSLPVTAPAVVSCPPAASIRGRPGRPVGGAGRRTLPAAVRHSPWVSYHLPVAREAGKTVALTFDDGPDPRYTPRVLAVLARARTPAAFFMVGRQAAAHPQLVRRVAQAGQQVDGHTWNHLGLDRLPPAQVAAEVDCTNRLLARLAGRPVRLLRPPDGAYDKTVVDLLATRRLQLILWTVDSRDWARPGVRRILATVARELRPGRSSCCTTAAATAPRPSPRCPRCCGSCTPAATGPSPCLQCSGAGQTVRPVGGQAGPAAGAAGGECGAVSERSQQ